jgi:serine protease Do
MFSKNLNKKYITSLAVASTIGIAALAMQGCVSPSQANTGQSTQTTGTTVATAATTTPPTVNSEYIKEAVGMQRAFNEVARSAEPSVVTITTMEHVPTPTMNFGGRLPRGFGGPGSRGGSDPFDDLFRQFFGSDGQAPGRPNGLMPNDTTPPGSRGRSVRAGLGSGFIIRQDGLILTNAHVVRGADTVTVKLSDGHEYKNAKVLGQDDRTDVAVVKIPATNLPTVTIGDSDQVNVGDWAIAVGNPFGLEHTVTVGVISAKGRQVPLSENGPGQYLQTDASINPGNSGGPLLDIYGHVIGINNAIYSESGGNVGIGFAIPIDTARKIADALVKEGRVRRARLGVAITDVGEQATAFGLPANTKGALVESVEPDSPASRAGLQPGDVITGINGQAVTASNDLQTRVADSGIGSSVTLDVLHNGNKTSVTARLEELQEQSTQAKAQASSENNPSQTSALGVQIAPLTPEIAQQLGLKENTHGVVVMDVMEGSGAQAAGIQRGDVIERVAQTPVSTPSELKNAVSAILNRQSGDDKSVALYINRQGTRHFVVVNP